MEVLIASIALIAGLKMFLDFKREERDHKDITALADCYQKEIDKIAELKAKVDTLSLKVGLR